MVPLMSTSSATDDTADSTESTGTTPSADPTAAIAAATAATGGPATTALTKTPEGFGPATPAAAGPWVPRPHEQLSPEQKAVEDLTDEELEALTGNTTSKGVVGGAFAIAAAGLGFVSISGSWLSTLVYQRQGLIGSIASSGKATSVILKDEYLSPWHKVAEINGVFAAVAALVGIIVLVSGRFLASKPLPAWVRAVAWGALALGIIGLCISGAMYFDVFTSVIKVPAAAASSTSG